MSSSSLNLPKCSSFCHDKEPCSITATGRCDVIKALSDDLTYTARTLEITTGQLATLRESLKSPVVVHAMMLRGEIAYTPEHLRHVLGDSLHNA